VDATAVGHWGEELVFKYLQAHVQDPAFRVEWVNEAGERGEPYDIKITLAPSLNSLDADTEELVRYVEVGKRAPSRPSTLIPYSFLILCICQPHLLCVCSRSSLRVK
jgi:hypothetical protein